jgi:hypothetical protein
MEEPGEINSKSIYTHTHACVRICPELNVAFEWLILLHIREVPGSNLSMKTSYPELRFFCGFLQSLQENAGIVP